MKLHSELYYSDLKQITESSDGKENIKLAEERQKECESQWSG